MSIPIENIVLQDNATTTGVGKEYLNSYNGDIITFTITGTSTSRTIIFEGKDIDGLWLPLICANTTTSDINTQTTGINERWQADITGLVGFRTRISSIVGGTVNITGRVVS